MLQITTNKGKKVELLYPELSYKITGVCFAVHNALGQFAREKQYGDLLEKKFAEAGMIFQRELLVGNIGNILDFVVENKIIVELKAKRLILAEDYRQLQNYLQESGLQLGLLINFRNKYLKPARVVRIEKYVVK
ncbi:MAG: GxxExxY protein [Candidatus Taylorbacteria bacterium]|nr:GxxExxY protein [Candidatus Taylorbacteria bacterium]